MKFKTNKIISIFLIFILFISTVGYDIVSAIDEENSETIIVTTDLENSDINSLNTEELGLIDN